jgi:hypothetical protein
MQRRNEVWRLIARIEKRDRFTFSALAWLYKQYPGWTLEEILADINQPPEDDIPW